jgi:hypothetical protein
LGMTVATVLWDAIELRFEAGTGAVYWRSE